GIPCRRFVGQATKDQEKGLSQKMQIDILKRFREGEFRVLIATSVGEEGLDVPSTDMVIFYEAVPSEIRSIQRKGRTGRSGAGRIVVLVTKGTSDEVYRYVSQRKEEAMVQGMRFMSSAPPAKPHTGATGQLSIDAFVEEEVPLIGVDDRESASRVVECLSGMKVRIDLHRLDIGDYAIGDRIRVERKTARDFMDTLVERDLLGQLGRLADAVPRPVLIIEGEDLYRQRDIHPNAVRGTLAAIAVDMGIAIFFSKDEEETAEILYILARREEEGPGERKLHPHKTYRSLREQQEYIVSAFPSIGLKNARLLLSHFGSIQAIVNADEKDLLAVKGIGEKTAEQIKSLSQQKYS
ncbi:MAG TPA: ERCC4 domain-containing protein, partial [Methanomicrobiales archaeon]|nr:ERCC4 domain-containing protein [Methanomicrobiales archaeon]